VAAFGAGVLLWTMALLAVDHVHSGDRRLISQGAGVTGVVTAVTLGGAFRSGSAKVSYTAGGRGLIGTVDLGSDADRFTVGQKVEVRYDQHRPTRMTIAGMRDQSGWSVWLAVLVFVGGCAFMGAAPIRTWRWIRSRRVLADNPWREVHDNISMDARNRVVAEIDAPTSPGIYRSPITSVRRRGMPPKPWTTGTVWIAGPAGRRAVLAMPGGGHLLYLRSPRT
jgi:hypothetical protein